MGPNPTPLSGRAGSLIDSPPGARFANYDSAFGGILTVAIAVTVADGIVLAADSRTTAQLGGVYRVVEGIPEVGGWVVWVVVWVRDCRGRQWGAERLCQHRRPGRPAFRIE